MDETIIIHTSHLTTPLAIAGALTEAGGSDSLTPPAGILAWADQKKMGTVAAKTNWVLIKTKKGSSLYHFFQTVKLS